MKELIFLRQFHQPAVDHKSVACKKSVYYKRNLLLMCYVNTKKAK